MIDWACAKRDADDDVAGLLPPRLAAVGAALKCGVVPDGALADAAESTGEESSKRLERRGAAGGLDAGDGGARALGSARRVDGRMPDC